MEQEMTAQATCAAPSTLDLLLGAEVVSIKANLPTARYEIPRLSEAAGAPVVFTLRALPYGRVQELKRLTEEADIQILLAGCVDPDLKAAALQEKFQGVTPGDTQGHAAAGRDRRSGDCGRKAVRLPADYH